MFLISNFKEVLYDIKNYFTIVSSISKNKNTKEWRDLNLNHDWIRRIYTVINLQKEDFGESEEVRRIKINKKLAMPIYNYLTERLNLFEVLKPKIKYLDGTYSYLLYFSPLFYRLSLWYVIKFIAFCYIMYLTFNLLNIEYWIHQLIKFLADKNIIKF